MVNGQWSMAYEELGEVSDPSTMDSSFTWNASRLTSHPSPRTRHVSRFTFHVSPFPLHALRSSAGFTLLEMLIALFLLGGVLVVVLPRISFEEDLRSTGRKLVGVLRTVQGQAATDQTPLRLYLDLDQGLYWMMVIEGKEERLPLNPAWKVPRRLPESVRLTEVSIGQDKRMSGRVGVTFFPNGRIEPVTMYFMDNKNDLLGISVDSLTGTIRVGDERFDPPPNRIIPDRVKILLKAGTQTGSGAPQGGSPALRGGQ
jgi:prepilin-type N-terminal cleavage/methylation domain-containing protein